MIRDRLLGFMKGAHNVEQLERNLVLLRGVGIASMSKVLKVAMQFN